MVPREAISNPPSLSCQVCFTEIPPSVANSLEGRDYVQYYCGAECYVEWEQQTAQPELALAEA